MQNAVNNYEIMGLSENLPWDTLGDRDFSCAVSGFGQVFMVTRFAARAEDFVGLWVKPRHPFTREIACVASISARVIAQKFERAGGFGMTELKGQLKHYVLYHDPAMFILHLFTWLFCSVRTLQGRLVRPKVPCVMWCKPNWLPHVRRHRVSHLKTTACFNAITCLPFWEFFIRVL